MTRVGLPGIGRGTVVVEDQIVDHAIEFDPVEVVDVGVAPARLLVVRNVELDFDGGVGGDRNNLFHPVPDLVSVLIVGVLGGLDGYGGVPVVGEIRDRLVTTVGDMRRLVPD